MKRKQERAETSTDGMAASPLPLVGVQPLLLGATVALVVATPLITSDPTMEEGNHVVLIAAWLVVLATWFVVRAARGTLPIRLDWLTIVVLLFFAWHSCSGLLMAGAGHGRPLLNATWTWISFAAAFFLLRGLIRTRVALRALVSVVLACGVGLAAFAVYEYAYTMPAARAQFERNPDQLIREIGIDAPPGSPERRQLADRIRATEPNATFALANSLAGFLIPPIVLGLGLLASARTGRLAARRVGFGIGIGVLVLILCLLLTKSRSAVLAVIVALVIVGLSRTLAGRMKWSWVLGVIVVLGGLGVGVFATGVWDRQVLTEAPKSVLYRIQFWSATGGMIHDHPWLGCGPGNYQLYYSQYKLPEASETVAEPHNFLLEIAATSGLPALLLLLVAGGLLVRLSLHTGTGIVAGDGASDGADATRSVRSVYGGACAGVVLAYLAGGAAHQFPDFDFLWVGVPVAALLLWCLDPWVRAGQLPNQLLGISLLALLVNLLAAGGIGIPGVGLFVWLLAALLASPAVSASARYWAPLGRNWLWATATGCGLLLLACYLTMYRPVLGAKHAMSQASASRDARESIRYLQAAADADCWWAQPYIFAAQVCQQQWLSSSSANWPLAFDYSVRMALRRDQHSCSLYQHKGDWLLEVYTKKGGGVLLERAVEAYQEAVALYPNSNFLHAQLAWTLFLEGKLELAQQQARRAIELDEQVPHRELKLASRRLVGQSAAVPTQIPPTATAEQCMLFLRNLKGDT